MGAASTLLQGNETPPRARTTPDTAGLQKAAHDIRTPLSTVLQSVDALLELPDDASERALRLFELLRRNVFWMGEVLEASIAHEPLPTQRVDLVALVNDVRDLIQPLLDARDQTILIEANRRRITIDGDYGSLARAVLNVVENASKHGPTGERIRIVVRRRSDGTVVSVYDRGPGIPAGERNAVFRAFYRTSTARSVGVSGSGLGLAVVREVIERHGGSVGVSSLRGETRVWLNLPDRIVTGSQRA